MSNPPPPSGCFGTFPKYLTSKFISNANEIMIHHNFIQSINEENLPSFLEIAEDLIVRDLCEWNTENTSQVKNSSSKEKNINDKVNNFLSYRLKILYGTLYKLSEQIIKANYIIS